MEYNGGTSMNGNGRYTSYTLADGKTTCPRRSANVIIDPADMC